MDTLTHMTALQSILNDLNTVSPGELTWLTLQLALLDGNSGCLVRGGDEYDILLDSQGTNEDGYVVVTLERATSEEEFRVLETWVLFAVDDEILSEIILKYRRQGGHPDDFYGASYF
jgi:hypothetical protein